MNISFRHRIGPAVIAVLCLVAIPSLGAQDPGPTTDQQSSTAVPDHRLVLRVTDDFLNSLLKDKKVDRQVPVRENILGTDVYGTARLQATPGVKLVETPDKATFYLTLKGTAHSRSTGYHGPAIVYSHAVTTFTAHKKVVLEPGQGFKGLPPVVTAKTTTFVDGIASVPGGIIGRIVRRRAGRTEAAQHNLVQDIARQRAEARIKAGFERTSNERLAKLNQAPELEALAALLKASGNGEIKYACCTTPHCLQVATFANGDSSGPIQLPFVDVPNGQRAPIELWMHESIINPRVAATVEVVKTAAKAIAPLESTTEEPMVTVHQVSDWRRVDVAAKPSQLMSLASLLPKPKEFRAKPILPDSPVPKTRTVASVAKALAPRVWTSGKYTAEATFVSLEGDTVHLMRTSGIGAKIAFEKLSATDQDWIRHHLANR